MFFNLIVIIFIVFVAIFLLIPTILFSVIGRILGLFSRKTDERRNKEDEQDGFNKRTGYEWKFTKRRDKKSNEKIFDKDEGEYVSFEEIKKDK